MLPREVRLALPSWVDEVVGPPRAWRGTEEKMALAIRLSAENVEREPGGGPFGAAVFRTDTGQYLKPDGTWMLVEPFAADRLRDNLNPVGRVYYAASTMVCTPCSLAQEVGLALGAQAGEKRLRDVASAGGFSRFRRAAETPFNIVYEARP